MFFTPHHRHTATAPVARRGRLAYSKAPPLHYAPRLRRTDAASSILLRLGIPRYCCAAIIDIIGSDHPLLSWRGPLPR